MLYGPLSLPLSIYLPLSLSVFHPPPLDQSASVFIVSRYESDSQLNQICANLKQVLSCGSLK